MRRAGGCAAAIFAVACGNHSGSGAFPGVGPDAGVDARLEAASVADEGVDGDAFAGSDAAVLPACDLGKTCALPLVCDESDLLCEPACDATQPCGAGTSAAGGASTDLKSAGATISRYSMSGE